MKTALYSVLLVLTTACSDGPTTTNNYYYGDTGGKDSTVHAKTSSEGGSDAGTSLITDTAGTAGTGVAGESNTDGVPNPLPVSCTLDRIKNLGPAFDTSSITATPNGFLAQWKSAWGNNSNIQTFDLNGNTTGEQSLLTESHGGVYPIVGSSRGFVVKTHDEETRIIRLDSNGSIICSKPIIRTTFGIMTSGEEREIYVTEDQYLSVNSGLVSEIKMYYVADDCELAYINSYSVTKKGKNDGFSIQSVVQNGNKLLIAMDDHSYATDDFSSDVIRRLTYLIYDLSLNKMITGEQIMYSSDPNSSSPFTIGASSTTDDFSIVWGINGVSDPEAGRYVTNITIDGAPGLTHNVTLDQPVGFRYVDSNRLLHAAYDETTAQRSFLMYTLTGSEKLAELPISIGRNYYLGYPDLATNGKGKYAMSWIEEREDFTTSYQVAFFHCTE